MVSSGGAQAPLITMGSTLTPFLTLILDPDNVRHCAFIQPKDPHLDTQCRPYTHAKHM